MFWKKNEETTTPDSSVSTQESTPMTDEEMQMMETMYQIEAVTDMFARYAANLPVPHTDLAL
jgi:hypothetical protein